MKNLALHWKILIGLGTGLIWAIVSTLIGWNKFTLDWILPWGTIFINLLKLIAVPLVLFSVIKGMMDLKDVGKLGRIGIKTLSAYLVTTVFAVSIGLIVVNVFQPGNAIEEQDRIVNRISYELWVQSQPGAIMHDDKHLLTDPAYAAQRDSALVKLEVLSDSEIVKNAPSPEKIKSAGPLQFVIDMVPSNIFLSLNNTLMLQVIFFAIFFGITLLFIPKDKASPVNSLIDGFNEVFLKMVDIVMKAAPFFVFALIAGKMTELSGGSLKSMVSIFQGLGAYMLVVILGLAIILFAVYPGIYIMVVAKKMGIPYGKSYRFFFNGLGPAQLLAFSTSSSAATLPVTMECVKDRMGVEDEISSFVLPIGATVNMDGTSLYQAVAVVFLAQMHMVDLNLMQQLTIVLTATLASIGSAAVPSAGLIMMIMVLESVGLPAAWIAIIFPVDRILDMCRTVINVTGDATVCSVIAATEGGLKKMASS